VDVRVDPYIRMYAKINEALSKRGGEQILFMFPNNDDDQPGGSHLCNHLCSNWLLGELLSRYDAHSNIPEESVDYSYTDATRVA